MFDQKLLRYILVGLVIAFLLRNFTNVHLGNEQLMLVVVCVVVVLYLMNRSGMMPEGMESIPEEMLQEHVCSGPGCPCNGESMIPNQYGLTYQEEDYAKTGLPYDNNCPDHQLIHDGVAVPGTAPFTDVSDAINTSRLNDLYQQANHVRWSPHTHLGKARGYLNWGSTYPSV